MDRLKRFFFFFAGLGGKLNLTYTLVTVSALLALEILAFGVLAVSLSVAGVNKKEYISDVIFTLYPQAARYLEGSEPDIPGLQTWLDEIYRGGFASLPPQGFLDSPAAPITPGQPIYALSPDYVVLAQSPNTQGDLTGRVFTLPDYAAYSGILERASEKELDSMLLHFPAPSGSLLVAFPVLSRTGPETLAVGEKELLGFIVLNIEPPPPLLFSTWPVFLLAIGVTGVVLMLGVAPFGALFGFIMSRSLTRRLNHLAVAADAWSHGDFSAAPQDRSKDEIGELSTRLRYMAGQLQELLHTRQALAALEARNQLARELHDTVKQQAFATMMQVRSAQNLLDTNPAAAQHHLQEAEKLIKTSQMDLGLIIQELRPSALEDQGLAPALRAYSNAWSQHTGINAHMQVQNEEALPLGVEYALFRVAQEALSNVARHSGATVVNIILVYSHTLVTLEITDNGSGFDPFQSEQIGFGIESMRQRVQELEGALTVKSLPGGTSVFAQLPFP